MLLFIRQLRRSVRNRTVGLQTPKVVAAVRTKYKAPQPLAQLFVPLGFIPQNHRYMWGIKPLVSRENTSRAKPPSPQNAHSAMRRLSFFKQQPRRALESGRGNILRTKNSLPILRRDAPKFYGRSRKPSANKSSCRKRQTVKACAG